MKDEVTQRHDGTLATTLASEMVRLRLSMLLINDMIKQKAFSVPIHLALGHEAIAVAVSKVMDDNDRLLLTHRNIHYNIARSFDLSAEIDEYRLSKSGQGGGAFGAMNLTNPEAGIVYTSSILGNCLPVAVGVAKALAVKGHESATLAVTGDGALEEGAFYEALMMACSLKMPIIYLIENNEWSMYTRIDERRCDVDLSGMAQTFDIPYVHLEGGNPEQYVEVLASVRKDVVSKSAPAIVEVSLSTLGDFHVHEENKPPRYINYHHGGVAALKYEGGPVIEESARDPVYLASQAIPASQWGAIVASVRNKLGPADR